MKPSGFSLSVDATRDVFADRPLLLHSMKFVFPMIVVLGAIAQSAKATDYAWISYCVIPFTLFAYGCFTLNWHRYSLRGAVPGNTVNPFRLGKEEWSFLFLFVIIMIAYTIVLGGIGLITQGIMPQYLPEYEKPAAIAGVVLIILLMPVFIRVLFLLPAKSIGMKIGFKDAARAARGMVWPVLAANLIFCLLFFVFVVVYMFSIGAGLNLAIGADEISPVAAVILSVLGALPLQMAVLILLSLYTVTISKAYQWGIQNNAIETTEKA